MAYDRADWHYGAENYPKDLPPQNGGTHIGMFLAWAILHGLESEFHREESSASLSAVRARQMTGRQFLFKECDEKFWDEDLSDDGNAFAKEYYNVTDEQGCRYLEDFYSAFPSVPAYHVEDTWQNYDKIAPLISRRFEEWKQKR
jgi:hypothetical protein